MTTQLNISHPGIIVARILDDLGINAHSFAMNLGVRPATITRFLAGNNTLTSVLAIRITVALGNTPEYWLGLQSAYDLSQWEGHIDTSEIKSYYEPEEESQMPSVLNVDAD
ncbi:addiction module antidote protein, HigA family [Lelliottia aquatilis]|uniref:HigA family addiction module antitoxin n=1 Tax=Lelliottia aquatilis TaxID=2080838 RepID=UPI000CDE8C1F|nr:HigA family addiction module antitoxin [Lelliottia aquatilis]POZ13645.1 addiction module antidote protein, HigA family [Lelliottia aquatilis]